MGTPSAEELLKAGVAVGLVVLLLEGALVQLAEAEGTDEVLGVVLAEHGRDAATRDGLVAARAKRAPLGVVVRLAEGLPLVVVEAATIERLPAVAADEAFGMPLAIQGRDVVLSDWPIAATALGRKQLEVVIAAVRLAILLVESSLAKLRPAVGAEKVLRVPCLVQGGHTFIQYGTIAVGTSWGEDVVVVCLAVGLIVPLKEVLGAQLLVAVSAHKVLGVPCATKGSDHLADDGLGACGAVSLGRRGDPLFGQVRLKSA